MRYKIGKTTEAYAAYSAGRLPPGHLHARAKRWAVKLFGVPAPKPYVLSQLEHGHEI